MLVCKTISLTSFRACVQKYLLEKSRICSQAHSERSYHVFYYLLAGSSPQLRQDLHLLKPSDYRYLNQVCIINLFTCIYLLIYLYVILCNFYCIFVYLFIYLFIHSSKRMEMVNKKQLMDYVLGDRQENEKPIDVIVLL